MENKVLDYYFRTRFDFEGYKVKVDRYLYKFGEKQGLVSEEQANPKSTYNWLISTVKTLQDKLIAQGYTQEQLDKEYCAWLEAKKDTELNKYYAARYEDEGYNYGMDEHWTWYGRELGWAGDTEGSIAEKQSLTAGNERKKLEMQVLKYYGYTQERLDKQYSKWLKKHQMELIDEYCALKFKVSGYRCDEAEGPMWYNQKLDLYDIKNGNPFDCLKIDLLNAQTVLIDQGITKKSLDQYYHKYPRRNEYVKRILLEDLFFERQKVGIALTSRNEKDSITYASEKNEDGIAVTDDMSLALGLMIKQAYLEILGFSEEDLNRRFMIWSKNQERKHTGESR